MNAATESLETSSALQTEELGGRIAASLGPGDVVLVSGEVGTGKTTLIRGACRSLGVRGPITSPTFTIGHRYQGTEYPVSHLDLYRLASLEGEDPAILDDYVDPDTVAFIEWSEPAWSRLDGTGRVFQVRLGHSGGDRRQIEFEEGVPPPPQ